MSVLNDEAKALLLQLIAANGGRMGQLDIVTALGELIKEGKVETIFEERRRGYIMKYDYRLTKAGKEELQKGATQ